jgi:hypothetical protein
MARQITVCCFGGGSNSSALMIGVIEKKIPVDLILFADTGCERPETYCHVKTFSEWLVSKNYPPIITVQQVNRVGEKITLEKDCIRLEQMPSLVYGFKSCSQKFKLYPQEKYINNWQPALDAWSKGEKILKLVGFDFDEDHRIKEYDDPKYNTVYPLVDWQWDRKKCIEVIEAAGLSKPGKSSCWCCPSMKKHEISELKNRNPELLERAIAIERVGLARARNVKGLGRDFSWEMFAKQGDLFPDMYKDNHIDLACGCYDG